MDRRQAQGFTLIELMIVITIIGVITAIAVPMFATFSTRSKVTEGVSFASVARKAVSDALLSNGHFPENNAEAGLGDPGEFATDHIASLTVAAGGVITVVFSDSSLAGGSIVFTPQLASGGTVRWTCSTATIPHTLVPGSCRN